MHHTHEEETVRLGSVALVVIEAPLVVDVGDTLKQLLEGNTTAPDGSKEDDDNGPADDGTGAALAGDQVEKETDKEATDNRTKVGDK